MAPMQIGCVLQRRMSQEAQRILSKLPEERTPEEVNFVSTGGHLGPYAPQGSASLLPKLSVTSKVSARTSCAWVGSRVYFGSSEDVILLEFTSPVNSGYMRRRRKFH